MNGAYRHGLRVSELVSLKWNAVDFENRQMHVARRKNGKPNPNGSSPGCLPDRVKKLLAYKAVFSLLPAPPGKGTFVQRLNSVIHQETMRSIFEFGRLKFGLRLYRCFPALRRRYG
jgi:integrase